MNAESRRIVETALALRASYPAVPALDVPDEAMNGHHGINPEFDDSSSPAGDHTDPPSPFARLLRDAFAPDIADADFATHGGASNEDAFWLRWEEGVMQPFAARYGLWSA
jgi:hypothetical protein